MEKACEVCIHVWWGKGKLQEAYFCWRAPWKWVVQWNKQIMKGLFSIRTLESFGTLKLWTDFHFRKVIFQICGGWLWRALVWRQGEQIADHWPSSPSKRYWDTDLKQSLQIRRGMKMWPSLLPKVTATALITQSEVPVQLGDSFHQEVGQYFLPLKLQRSDNLDLWG